MKTAAICAALNTAVAYEHAASLQYKQQALLVRGLWRRVLMEFFAAESRKALAHAQQFGQKIVALGGVPTVEVGATVQQSLEVTEMLEHDVALERLALEAYLAAWRLTEGEDATAVALRAMLEAHIAAEQQDVDELELYLEMVQTEA
ncbi:MAG TPA: ferritin-like domain-containing protein [Candidatus Tectomicrobia bacterium]